MCESPSGAVGAWRALVVCGGVRVGLPAPDLAGATLGAFRGRPGPWYRGGGVRPSWGPYSKPAGVFSRWRECREVRREHEVFPTNLPGGNMRPGTSRTKPVRQLTGSKEREAGSQPRAGRHVQAGPGLRFPPRLFPCWCASRLCGWDVCGGRARVRAVVGSAVSEGRGAFFVFMRFLMWKRFLLSEGRFCRQG